MRFACLVYFDPTTAFDGSAENAAILNAAEVNRQELLAAGIAAEALMLPSSAVTVRVRGEEALQSDGPFAETKEVLGGFYVVEAANISEAVSIASANPMAKVGAVEVRPMVDFRQARPVV